MNPLSILRDTWFFFSRHLGTLLPLCLPWIVIETLVQQQINIAAGSQNFAPWGMAAGLVFYPIYTASLILFMIDAGNGEERTVRELWSASLRLWPAFALLSAITSLLAVVGLSLLLLPGIFILVKLSFSEFLLVQRGRTPIDAMRESFSLTTGHFFLLLTTALVIYAPIMLAEGWINQGSQDAPVLDVALHSVSGFLQLLLTIAAYRIFILLQRQES
jgi:hypothetical protein